MRFQSITQFRAVSHRLSISNCIFTFVSFVSFFFAAEAQPAVTQPGAVELYPIKAPTGPARRWSAGTGCDNAPPACSPAILHRKISTAFGEPVSTVNETGLDPSRYGYAGAYGYEEARTGDPLALLGWLHVGERYYAPELGRYVQRDPIGIRRGLNAYLYVENQPSVRIDPSGLSSLLRPDGIVAMINCQIAQQGGGAIGVSYGGRVIQCTGATIMQVNGKMVMILEPVSKLICVQAGAPHKVVFYYGHLRKGVRDGQTESRNHG